MTLNKIIGQLIASVHEEEQLFLLLKTYKKAVSFIVRESHNIPWQNSPLEALLYMLQMHFENNKQNSAESLTGSFLYFKNTTIH